MPPVNPPIPSPSSGGGGLGSSAFTSGQLTFIQRLAADTGLDPGVCAAWVYAEENGSAAQSRQAANNNNWLNIGYFDSGTGAIAFNSAFQDATTGADQTAKFLKGIWGGAAVSIQNILTTAGSPPGTQIAKIQGSGWASSGYPNLPQIYASLSQSFKTQLGSSTLGGGTFGAGGTGTPGNQAATSLWTVGDPSNPDQDYWTTINQYSMNAQWYCFSDAETLYVADGIQLMAQQPQGIISRLDPRVQHAECTYDNTAFMYTSTHRKRSHIQRRTGLARLTSPTQVSIDIICDIDQYRAGDTVVLAMFGPADGTWLIGDCTRSIYSATSSLTLVQAMQPINASTGLPGSTPFLTGKQASQATSGTVMAAMISEAQTITADDYPYVHGGGHKSAGTPDIGIPGGNGYDGHTVGFDCSGAVAAVLAAGGLWPFGGSVGNDASIVQTLLSQNKITPGQGTGRPECTLFDSPGVHIFMRLNGVYFGTSDGDAGNRSQPNGGAGWLYDSHSDVSTFRAYHVPQSILGQQASGA